MVVRATRRRASCTCRAWRSRPRFWSRNSRRMIWTDDLGVRWLTVEGEQHIVIAQQKKQRREAGEVGWWSFATCVGNDITVSCSLGWACWKMYLGRPGTCWTPIDAIKLLGLGLAAAHVTRARVVVVEAQLAFARRVGAVEDNILNVKDNVANCYRSLGRQDEATRRIRRAV